MKGIPWSSSFPAVPPAAPCCSMSRVFCTLRFCPDTFPGLLINNPMSSYDYKTLWRETEQFYKEEERSINGD